MNRCLHTNWPPPVFSRWFTLLGHPLSLHPIYKRPKELFSVNVFYMNPSLCPCKPSYPSKQSPIEAELLNLWPDGFPTPRQSGELQFVLKVWAQLSLPFFPLASLRGGGIIYSLSLRWRKKWRYETEMAVLLNGWHGSSGTRFPEHCQVEKGNKSESGKEDVPFFLSSQAEKVRWHCCFTPDKGRLL